MNHLAMFPRQNGSRYDDWIQTSRVRNRFTLTLGTVIRAYDGASVPIQTPSIYFAGRWQRLKHRRTPSSSIIWMYGAGVAHHSNGQDGCTFENQTRVNGACQSQPAGSSGVLNTKDGSFGVNYIEVRAARSSRTIVGSVEVGTALTLGLDYRLYVPWKFPPCGSGLTQIQHLFGRSEFQGLFSRSGPPKSSGSSITFSSPFVVLPASAAAAPWLPVGPQT